MLASQVASQPTFMAIPGDPDLNTEGEGFEPPRACALAVFNFSVHHRSPALANVRAVYTLAVDRPPTFARVRHSSRTLPSRLPSSTVSRSSQVSAIFSTDQRKENKECRHQHSPNFLHVVGLLFLRGTKRRHVREPRPGRRLPAARDRISWHSAPMSQRRTPSRKSGSSHLSKRGLAAMIEEATVDCYNESEHGSETSAADRGASPPAAAARSRLRSG